MAMTPEVQTPWDKLYQSYLEIEEAGHKFPLPARYLPTAGARVLDLGCGVGTYMRTFLTCTSSVVGVDISSEMVKQAARVAPVKQADSRALPFPNESFDYLWSRVVLSCIPDWWVAFEEALRVVRPGGRLVILVSNKYSAMTPLRSVLSRLGCYSEGFIKHLSVRDFKRHAGKYSFRVLENFAVQKEARSAKWLFRLAARLFYGIDRLIASVLPCWGGDLCIVIERTNQT